MDLFQYEEEDSGKAVSIFKPVLIFCPGLAKSAETAGSSTVSPCLSTSPKLILSGTAPTLGGELGA